LAFFFGSWIKYQQATSGKTPGPVPDRESGKQLNSNKQQAEKRRAGTSARSGRAEGPGASREGTRSKGPGATSTCVYKIYLIK